MPANINTFVSARVPAWHNLGKVLDHSMTWEEAVREANLDWQVDKRQLLDPITNEKVNAYGIFRSDSNLLLGVVGGTYEPFQNVEAFAWVDSILGKNGAHWETAGSLGMGETIFCTADIGVTKTIPGTQNDDHKFYIMFATSHDGTMAISTKLTSVRVVCQNTLSMALNDGRTKMAIRHSKQAKSKLDNITDVFHRANLSIDNLFDDYTELTKRKISRKSFIETLDTLFPESKNKEDRERVSKSRQKKLEIIAGLFESNDNNAVPEVRGTAYNLLNSITEYVDFESSARERSGKTESNRSDYLRSERSIFGTGATLKEQALEVILHTTKDDTRFDITTTVVPVPETHMSETDSVLNNIFNMVDV